jgi:hypothetical protein
MQDTVAGTSPNSSLATLKYLAFRIVIGVSTVRYQRYGITPMKHAGHRVAATIPAELSLAIQPQTS